MKNVTYILFLVFVWSCTSSSSVEFGVGQTYHLSEDEKLMPNSQEVIDKYNSFFDYDTFQFPLNKNVQSPFADVFMGIAVNDNAADIVKRLVNDSLAKMHKTNAFTVDEVPVDAFFYEKNSQFLHSLVYDFKNEQYNFGIMVSFVSEDSAYVRKTMDVEYLSKKLSLETY